MAVAKLRTGLLAVGLALLGACQTAPAPKVAGVASAAPVVLPKTRILNPLQADRLMHNAGVTLQWIGWDQRGTAAVTDRDGTWLLSASQAQSGGSGRLQLDGFVREIGRDYFLFDGTVQITDTPDKGRKCFKKDVWRFAITLNRPYWRIRTFEWCDGLTDYIDIYFNR